MGRVRLCGVADATGGQQPFATLLRDHQTYGHANREPLSAQLWIICPRRRLQVSSMAARLVISASLKHRYRSAAISATSCAGMCSRRSVAGRPPQPAAQRRGHCTRGARSELRRSPSLPGTDAPFRRSTWRPTQVSPASRIPRQFPGAAWPGRTSAGNERDVNGLNGGRRHCRDRGKPACTGSARPGGRSLNKRRRSDVPPYCSASIAEERWTLSAGQLPSPPPALPRR